jgi:hypothetical protein
VAILFFAYTRLTGRYGAISIPDAPYLFQTSLQSGIDSDDTSMTLVNGALKDGSSLSGYQCFTLDAGTNIAEYVCGTASSTSVTGLLRGINPLNPASGSADLSFSHRRGADVRITDFPVLQVIKRLVDGTDSFPSPLKLDTSISTTTIASNTSYLANVEYVNGVALQGAPVATTTVPGVAEIATTAEVIAGTGMNGQYTLIPAASLFKQTPSAAVIVPVTNSSGKLAQGFLDLTANWVFTNASSTNLTVSNNAYFATSTFSIAPTAPTSTPAGDTSLVTKYYADNGFYSACRTGEWAVNNSTHVDTIAHGLGASPKVVRITAMSNGATGSSVGYHSYGTYDSLSGNQRVIFTSDSNGASTTGTSTPNILKLYDSTFSLVASTTVNSTNIVLSVAETGTFPNNAFIIWEACK